MIKSIKLRKLAFIVALAFAAYAFPNSAAASERSSTYIGGGLTLSCGSSAGNFFWSCNDGICDYMHGGLWQFYADFACGDLQ
ncbi:MAG TPA: hypothetical protein VNM67_22155 [Thermoanaerobaculia bacterium]|nr:hypothetical protein [Thermoanaerobaculia bacterium]